MPREILPKMIPFLEPENILLLTGARQTGKTSLLYLLIKHLLNNDIPPFQIVYLDMENIYDFSLLQNLKDYNEFQQILKDKGVDSRKRVFVFIDEVQHLDKPSSFLKYLHDHYKPGLKFIVTGSSSLEIKKKFTDRLTGRIYSFVIKPLSFREFLEFKKEKDLAEIISNFNLHFWICAKHPEEDFKKISQIHKRRLNALLKEYLIFGGYPAVSLQENPLIKQRDLQEIYSLYIRRDIKDIGQINDVSGYNNLVFLLCLQIGNLVKEQELAVSSGLSRPTVKKYLFLLENTYVLKLVRPFFTNKRKEITKTPKVFFEDVGLRNGAINNFDPLNQRMDKGAIIENFVFSQLSKENDFSQKIGFWRSQAKNEVDFIWQENINKPYPIEVKTNYSSRQPFPPGLKGFINLYQPSRGFIVHLGEPDFLSFKKTKIHVLPAWAI
ncbi:MAG: ATP-binding protein [Desulfobacteraceae bacterium]|uniref:ATP-binding protein n=1 Tax=Candidatus Desulfaltia bathyphila TaxID=2841697 RepID=A0A8J6N8F0_9BACT|nr:ATP-binding protein [Candidatus Desulfaltia bathyphila]